ncbi:MAG: cell surface protein, partial [Polyangiaceae bacterium]|nr:cell surface protein [Polyangiaceae bacterium]
PNNFTAVAGLCEAGCYTGEQEVRFGDELLPIGRAFASGETKVTTLSPGATFDSLTFIVNDIARWTADIAPADQQLITLRMQSGGELRVTTEHPILTSEGVMKRAMDLVAGESLVREDGSPDPIESTETQTVFTRVYNLRPVTLDLATNIIVAQGYLNGSARYQSEYVKYLNRVLLRKKIPAGLIPRGARAEAKTLERSR